MVNTYTTEDQRVPEAAIDADGNFIVVWESRGADGDPSQQSVQAQRYAADGSARGTQFQVNTYTTGEQYRMAVAMDRTSGDFVVAWSSYAVETGDTSYFGVLAQRYAADGAALGGELRVNTTTLYSQIAPSAAMLDDGDFVVVWQSDGSPGSDSSGYSVQGQRFASDGSPLAGEFQINTYTTSGQRSAAVASSADGSFVVVWTSSGSDVDTSSNSVQGQRFSSSGAPVASQFQINTYTTDDQQAPVIAVAPDGGFLVAWESDGSDNGDTDQDSIQAQRFAPDGSPAGGQFQVNTYTTGRQANASVGVDGDGDFVVVWDSFGSDLGDDDRFSVQGRRYAANGDPVGGVFLVNTYTTDAQLQPTVAVDEAGDFVISWEGYRDDNGDASERSVQAQRFRVTADIGGRVFFDMGADGLQNVDDPGVSGVTVHLRDGLGNLLDSITTDDDGRYHFRPKIATEDAVDQFTVELEAPASRVFTFQNIGADDTIDSDVDPITGATRPFILTSAGDSLQNLDAGLSGPPLFADGFEMGDTMAWTAAFP
ncbi:MAG: SdrD B-like domain-containing protein [Acidobacteriota bacterium]